ncbi:GNAT family N-acetyltransferase [Tersicoccus sp. MR15.9]|uniref:GNAT family N-acetyltransferase n=1 Tax=Tersicoccus mangrovi TaxID=3121635 RepID=UPI002FE5C6B2
MDPAFTPLTPADTPAWAELTTVLAHVDGTEEFYSAEDLAEELTEDDVDPARDTWALRETDGDGPRILAAGQVRVRSDLLDGRAVALLSGGVHPDRRGQGIGRALMDVMEDRARELAAERHPGVPVLLRNPGGLSTDPVRRLLTHRDYRLSRYFVQMGRDLPEPTAHALAQPMSPSARSGYRIVPFRAELSAGAREARNAAFADHWGSTAISEAEWSAFAEARSLVASCSFLAVGDDGRVHSFCLAQDWQDGPLYLALIGTTPDARGLGLARACIAASLDAAARQRGQDGSPRFAGATLHVDADSPTGATRLYESAGFTAIKTFATFTREVDALPF